MPDEPVQNGTLEQYGKTWPMWERSTFRVTAVGFETLEEAERFRELVWTMVPESVTVKAEALTAVEMSEKDRQEKEVLDLMAQNGSMN